VRPIESPCLSERPARGVFSVVLFCDCTDTDWLLEVELVEEVPNTSPRRYRVADSDVVRELFELNSALGAAGDEYPAVET
jgi:hypothetical protein